MSPISDRCRQVSLALGRCGLIAGHDVPHAAAEAQDGRLRCIRWDESAEWLDLPSVEGGMSRGPLPWAADYRLPEPSADVPHLP